MTIQARYSGVCPDCGERWQPGDLIRFREDRYQIEPGVEHLGVWGHAHCPETVDPLGVRPGERVCTACWLVHPEGACDR